MKKSILILSVLGYIAFISCNKTEISSLQKSNNSEVLKKTKNYIIPGPCPYSCSDQRCMNYESGYCGYIPVINNPNNPYNYVGPNHNNGMDYSIPKINPSSPTLESDILNTTKAYVQTLGYNPNDFQSTYDQGVANGYFPFYKTPDLDSLGIIMTSRGQISSNANNYIQNIFNLGLTYINTDTSSIYQYNNLGNALVSLENSISGDQTLISSEKQLLLQLCAIGRYSAQYWANYLTSHPYTTTAGYVFNSYDPFREDQSDDITENGKIEQTSVFDTKGLLSSNNVDETFNINPSYDQINFYQQASVEAKSIHTENIIYNPYCCRFFRRWFWIFLSDVGGGLAGLSGGGVGIIGGAVGTSLATWAGSHLQ